MISYIVGDPASRTLKKIGAAKDPCSKLVVATTIALCTIVATIVRSRCDQV